MKSTRNQIIAQCRTLSELARMIYHSQQKRFPPSLKPELGRYTENHLCWDDYTAKEYKRTRTEYNADFRDLLSGPPDTVTESAGPPDTVTDRIGRRLGLADRV
jgi:hypothetical protein